MTGGDEVELYKWCPNCGKDELVSEREPKMVTFGTDGWGQPVRFSECECGQLYGWFNIEWYRDKNEFEFDEGFKRYLQHRIKFYLRFGE